MTRVSTFSQNTLLLNEVLRNQRRVFEAQSQIASGLKSPMPPLENRLEPGRSVDYSAL